MRKSKHETAQTRRRIVEAASSEILRKGIEETGIAEVMSAAGMTHGGFYKHFDSKDQVVKESLSLAADAWAASVKLTSGRSSGIRGLHAMIAEYLSANHRDDPSGGCPYVALGSELARGTDGVRDAATAGYRKLIDTITGLLPDVPPATAKKQAMVILSTMIGAMTMARVVTDPELSSSILRQARLHLTQ